MDAKLKAAMHRIGRKMVVCSRNCEGVANDPSKGILPRGIYLEDIQSGSMGLVIVGINPAAASKQEREFYCGSGPVYNQTVRYWDVHVKSDNGYYETLRKLAIQLGFGTILWTELVKCQNATGVFHLPLQARRTCANEFLRREVQAVPEDWPILAAGEQPFKAAAYLFASRSVIGIPHPTGSHGHYQKLLASTGGLRGLAKSVVDKLQLEPKQAIRL